MGWASYTAHLYCVYEIRQSLMLLCSNNPSARLVKHIRRFLIQTFDGQSSTRHEQPTNLQMAITRQAEVNVTSINHKIRPLLSKQLTCKLTADAGSVFSEQ